MAIASEKRVPRYLSLAAVMVSLGVTGWLFQAGKDNPRLYVADMDLNMHPDVWHQGEDYPCHKCHKKTGVGAPYTTQMGCYSSYCHGEFSNYAPRERYVELFVEEWKKRGQPEDEAKRRTEYYFALHDAAGFGCQDCHPEHKTLPKTPLPDGFPAYETWAKEHAAAQGATWKSVGPF
ncbi:MAG: hypothetical protein RLY93_09310 [Sumerlaeia bacterium]